MHNLFQNLDLVRNGMVNLAKQIENARFFGVHAIVAVNRFPYVTVSIYCFKNGTNVNLANCCFYLREQVLSNIQPFIVLQKKLSTLCARMRIPFHPVPHVYFRLGGGRGGGGGEQYSSEFLWGL